MLFLSYIVQMEAGGSLEIKIFKTRKGEKPFSAWLLGLKDQRARAKIRARIARMQLGNMGDFASVGGGVLELRIHYGPGFRVYFGQDDNVVVILLCGGDKQSQEKDIEFAKRLWEEYKHGN